MRCGVDHGPEGHGIGNLTVEPDILVGREKPSELGPDKTNDVTEHGNEDETAIIGKDEAGTARCPDREPEAVQSSELLVCFLVAQQRQYCLCGERLRVRT